MNVLLEDVGKLVPHVNNLLVSVVHLGQALKDQTMQYSENGPIREQNSAERRQK